MDFFDNLTIVGGGLLGRSLARAIASKKIAITLIDRDPAKIDKITKCLEDDLNHAITKWALTESEKNSIMRKITITHDMNLVKKSGIIIECINEDFELKANILTKLDKLAKDQALFVTTTSSLSITKLGAKVSRPELLIGMNFLLPVQTVPIVEVVRGLKTSDKTMENVRRFANLMGKEVITVYEYPGYVTTRVIIPLINEAMYVVMEGVASAEDVDKAIKLGYNFPKGPLSLADSIGLDTVLQWMEQLFHELGDLKYRPCPTLRKLVYANHLGVKTGEGFFKY